MPVFWVGGLGGGHWLGPGSCLLVPFLGEWGGVRGVGGGVVAIGWVLGAVCWCLFWGGVRGGGGGCHRLGPGTCLLVSGFFWGGGGGGVAIGWVLGFVWRLFFFFFWGGGEGSGEALAGSCLQVPFKVFLFNYFFIIGWYLIPVC